MNRVVIVILFSLLFQKTRSQVVFCPPGAEWHYSFVVSIPYSHYNAKIKYIKDSIVGTDTLKVLQQAVYYSYCNGGSGPGLTFIKQKGDTIFMKSASTRNSWQILYNYAATAGQTWTNSISCYWNYSITPVTYTVTVDSVGTTTINNFVLKQLFVRYYHPGWPGSAVITERFGCNGYLFNYNNPYLASDCDGAQKFLCYQDSAFGLKQFSAYLCDYQDYVGIQNLNYQNFNINIYPNPANEFITISAENVSINRASVVCITDLFGRTIKQVALNFLDSESNKVDISDLANGIYILSLKNNRQETYIGKLVKTGY